ncbi:EAL domain-containing protein [Pseudorhodoplanes sp.]|uniref:bifunctional diguanylate cyclase/phosphodiesterase n=1 Tax=Pseudorhodoplanes sp. TaxID=1934341 RepID=UPI00391E02ED
MFPSSPRISFRGLLLVALGLIGTAVAAIGITIVALRQDAISDAVNNTSKIATVLAQQTAEAVRAIDNAASEIAERLGSQDALEHGFDAFARSEAAHRFLADRLSRIPQTEVIALIDKDGQFVNASRGWPVKSVNLSDRDYFAYARDHGDPKLFVSRVVRNRVSQQQNVFFAKRINGPKGEFLGIVLAGIKPAYFQHIYRSIQGVDSQSFALLRDDGTLLVRYPELRDATGTRLPPTSKWYQMVQNGGGLYTSLTAFDGTQRLTAIRPLENLPLVVNVGIPQSEALASWRHRATTIAIGTALALICSLLLIYALYHQFVQLAESQASLREREARLAEKTAELEEVNCRLDTAVDNIIQGLVMFNSAGEMVLCNNRFIEIYGLNAEQVRPGISIREVLELRTKAGSFFDDIDAYIDELMNSMRAGKPLVKITQAADGRSFCVTNMPTAGGGWVATHEDITERRANEKELQQTRNMLHTVVENSPEMLVVKDVRSGKFVFLNRAGEDLLGISRENFVGKTVEEVFPRDTAERAKQSDENALRSGQFVIENRRVQTLDGRDRYITSKRFAIRNQQGEPEYILNVVEDVTKRLRGEQELQRTRNMLRAVVENIPEMLVVKDAASGRYVFVNRAGEELLGIERDDMVGKTTEEIFPRDEAQKIVMRDKEALRMGQLKIDSHLTVTPDGRLRDIVSKRVAIGGKDDSPEYLLTVIQDVTERKRNESRIAHLAHHDPLTDLANRAAFNAKLSETLDHIAAANGRFALLAIDLDRFKEVNDLYGHAAGDKVLLEISRRMKEAVGSGAFLARLGGDEFTAILTDDATPENTGALAQRLIDAVSGEIDCDGRKVRLGMSIGVAMYPADGTDMAALLRNADAALYRAKAEGRSGVRFFEAEMDRMLHDRRALQADLTLAVTRNELQLYYQPQARISGQVIGFEALLRWDHLRRGFVPPDTFIPLAEESGLIDRIGEWVLREACREAAAWRNPLQIAINLSPVQMRQADLVPMVHSVLLESGLAPDRMVLEITEGALMDDYSRAVSILRRLKALGVRIAMDDFGTGYSSLSYLQSFPFDKIKIDQTFIANLERNTHSGAIVRAVLGLGRSLNLTTVAEGVETQTQLAILRGEGCDEMQGYLIGRPQPIAEYAELIGAPSRKRRTTVAS